MNKRPANYSALAQAARAKATQGHIAAHLLPCAPTPTTKLETLRNAFQQGDLRTAVAIAARFPNLGKERDAILAAHTAYTNPHWVTQLGKNPAREIALGVQALTQKYGL